MAPHDSIRFRFREHAHVMPTRTHWWQRTEWLWPVLALPALVLVFGAAAYWDERAETEQALRVAHHEAELLRTYSAGRSQGHADMVASATGAWQAAQTEAARCRAKAQP